MDSYGECTQDDVKEKLLDDLLDGSKSFSEVEEESERLKTMITVKREFMKEVQLETWEQVEETMRERMYSRSTSCIRENRCQRTLKLGQVYLHHM